MRIITKRGYDFGEVSSAMQKAIRRADTRLAGYWALELWASGFGNYVWKRLLTVCAEDVWGLSAPESVRNPARFCGRCSSESALRSKPSTLPD